MGLLNPSRRSDQVAYCLEGEGEGGLLYYIRSWPTGITRVGGAESGVPFRGAAVSKPVLEKGEIMNQAEDAANQPQSRPRLILLARLWMLRRHYCVSSRKVSSMQISHLFPPPRITPDFRFVDP